MKNNVNNTRLNRKNILLLLLLFLLFLLYPTVAVDFEKKKIIIMKIIKGANVTISSRDGRKKACSGVVGT